MSSTCRTKNKTIYIAGSEGCMNSIQACGCNLNSNSFILNMGAIDLFPSGSRDVNTPEACHLAKALAAIFNTEIEPSTTHW